MQKKRGLMMSDYLINRLYFTTNTKIILNFLKSKNTSDNAPPQFSLNSIRAMPASLNLHLNQYVMQLARMNMEMPPLDEMARQVALSKILTSHQERQSETAIRTTIEALGNTLKQSVSQNDSKASSRPDKTAIEAFEQAVYNYDQYQFFCHYDWRFSQWGTVEDIHSVVPSSFEPPISYIEFETKWTPPISALESLANAFPSVRFKLRYHYGPDDDWTTVDLFPLTPFGY